MGTAFTDIIDEGIDTGPLIEHKSLPLDLDQDYLNQLLALYQSAVPRLARIIEQTRGSGAYLGDCLMGHHR